jgi:hypothetical protein
MEKWLNDMVSEEALDRLYKFFVDSGYTWSINNVVRKPTRAEMEQMLESLGNTIKDETVSISVESGRLLVKNTDGHLDVWIWAGEL